MGWCPRSSPARRGRGESRRMRPTAGAAGRHPARHGGGKLRLEAEQVRRLFARSTLSLRARYFSWSLFSAKSPMCCPHSVAGWTGESEGPRNLTSMHVCTRSHLDLTLEDRRTCAPAHRHPAHAPRTPAVSAHRHQPATSQPPPHLQCTLSLSLPSRSSLSQIGISLSHQQSHKISSLTCSLSVARVGLSPPAPCGLPGP